MSSVIETMQRADDDREAGRGVMRVLDPNAGDFKVTWDPDDATEVEHARKTFRDLRAKGMAAYAVKKGGGKGKLLHEFDPKIDAMIMAPALQGG